MGRERNGETRQVLSQQWEQAARPYALWEGCPKACPEQPALGVAEGKPKEAKVQGNAWDRLTCLPTGRRGPVHERARVQKESGSWAGANGCRVSQRTEDRTQVQP